MDHLSLAEVEEAGICHLMGRWAVEEEEVAVGMWVSPGWVGKGAQGPCQRTKVHPVPEEVEEEQGHLLLQEEGEVGGELWARSRRVAEGTRLWPEEEVAEQWYSDVKCQQAEEEVVRWCRWGWRQVARWEQKVEAQRCRGWICIRDTEKKPIFSCSAFSHSDS